jgi:hypothetical protein
MSKHNLDWHKDMDALYEYTEKNWWKTGRRNVATAVSGSISLESRESKEKDKKTLDKNRSL